jgi:hypothetical protein
MTQPRAGARLDPEQVEAQVGTYLDGLRGLVAAEQQARADAEQYVAYSKARERKWQRAIDALSGEVKPIGRPKATPKPKPKVAQPVGQEAIARVETFLREQAQPVTRSQIVEGTGLNKEVTRRALDHLRTHERIRLAGKQGSGPTASNLWAVMPNA